MIRFARPAIVSRPAAADLAADWFCPLCGSLLDRSVGEYCLNLRDLVFLSEDEDGVPCYGLRRGARLRGRDVRRKPSTDARIMAAMNHGRSDYRLMDMPVFDTYCGNCSARVRIDVTRAIALRYTPAE